MIRLGATRSSSRKKKPKCSNCNRQWVKEENISTGLCVTCLQELVRLSKKKSRCTQCHQRWVKDEDIFKGLCVTCLQETMNENMLATIHDDKSEKSQTTSTVSDGLYDAAEDLPSVQSDSLESSHIDINSIDDISSDITDRTTEYLVCINCNRSVKNLDEWDGIMQEMDVFEQYRRLAFRWVPLHEVHMKYKWCLFNKEEAEGDNVLMCTQCAHVCCMEHFKTNALFAWPSFIWNVLKNADVQNKFGKELWQLIPLRWRGWWLRVVRTFDCFHDVTLLEPEPYTTEVSDELKEISDAMRDLVSLKLFKVLDKHILIPKVKCPWGCVQFLNMASAHVHLDQIFLDFLDYPIGMITMSGNKYPRWLEGIRPNFIRSKHYIAGKGFGCCMPSIAFDKIQGPVILTCGDHSIHSKGQYVHPPPSPFGWIASNNSDQFAPAVIKPRTVQSVKRRKYSDCYHTVRMKGSYEGIDTLTLSNQGHYNIDDPLTIQQDSLAILARPDISSHIKKLAEEGTIPHSLADAKHNIAIDLFPRKKLVKLQEQCRKWATYIPISTAFVMEKFIKTDTEIEIEVFDTISQVQDSVQFRPVWPSQIVYIHPCTSYGRRPLLVAVKTVRAKPFLDTRLLWLISCISIHCQHVYHAIHENIANNWDWHGWFMKYLCQHYLLPFTGRGSKNDPF